MDKFVVAIFPSEAAAYEGTRVMNDLQAEGSLALYGLAVITKTADGKISTNETLGERPAGAGTGALLGGLIGLMGGALGAAAGGAIADSWHDLFNLGIGEDFLDSVSQELTLGKSAVVAEVDEEWVTPLDQQLEAIGGTVLRQARTDFLDHRIQQALNADEAELAELQAEYRHAREEHKAKLMGRINEAQAKLRSAADRARARQEQLRREADAKIRVLEEQRAKATADAKARHERRIAELRADYNRRVDDLGRAAGQVDLETLVV
jgi:uncharacterized membrane protein